MTRDIFKGLYGRAPSDFELNQEVRIEAIQSTVDSLQYANQRLLEDKKAVIEELYREKQRTILVERIVTHQEKICFEVSPAHFFGLPQAGRERALKYAIIAGFRILFQNCSGLTAISKEIEMDAIANSKK